MERERETKIHHTLEKIPSIHPSIQILSLSLSLSLVVCVYVYTTSITTQEGV
jgi:hypothetical protein